jgi:hypothetical protein
MKPDSPVSAWGVALGRGATAACLIAMIAWAAPVFGQAVGSASIYGTVTDTTGGTLPGVTVTLTSPALQRPEMLAVTADDGSYRFADLPIGTYRLSFGLAGFQPVVREGVRLTAGFTARVDIPMGVGSVEETITVAGDSPVVDVATTTGSVNITREVLDVLPMTSAYQIMALAPGVRGNNRPEVGGGQLATQLEYKNYGTAGGITPLIEGVNTRQDQARHCFFYDDLSIEDSQVKTVGNTADVGPQGANWVMVVKSGGNQFHSTSQAQFETPRLQASNIDEELESQGVTGGDALESFRNLYFDLGGRLVRDRLWFYGALRDQRSVVLPVGFSASRGADGIYGTPDDPQAESRTDLTNQTLKMTSRVGDKYQLVGFVQRGYLMRHASAPSRFRPLESAELAPTPTVAWKGELQATPNTRTLLNVVGGYHWYVAPYWMRPETAAAGEPSRFDRNTGMMTGPQRNQSGHRGRYQTIGSISFFPDRFLGGGHNFKVGYQAYFEYRGENYPDIDTGNYRLIYDAGRPVEIETHNRPVIGAKTARSTAYAAYAMDQWRLGRFTTNLGVRYERYHAFLREQTKVQGAFGESGTYPERDLLTWNAIAPRAGVAYDLRGDGKTVLKGSYGIYRHVLNEDYAQNFNQNNLIVTRYRWADLDGNNDYTPGEVSLTPTAVLGVSGGRNNLENPDLEQPTTHEFSAGVDREVMPGFAARALYVYKRQVRLYENTNALRPYSAWNVPLSRRDPGPDGALNTPDDGGAVTVYDFDPAYRGSAFVGNMFVNYPDGRYDDYHTIEVTLTRRLAQRWSLIGTVAATKNHRWIDGIPDSPNDELFPLDETWDTQFKLIGSYLLPWNVQLGAFFQRLQGDAGQRTYIFRAADPDGGPSIVSAGTVTARMEPYGDSRSDPFSLLNLKTSKRFVVRGTHTIDFDFDLYNVLNSNTATIQTWTAGPSYGAITSIVPPRLARLGLTYRF